jgi:hypothetical protein
MLVLLTLAIVASYRTARYFLTPESFGDYGWYRGAAIQEIASRKPTYAGKKACDECHSEILQKLTTFEHKTISCESCHGASKEHADNPDAHDPSVPIAKLDNSLCLRCHDANPSRPTWLKQIVPTEHYGTKTKVDRCLECHLPHQPNEVPEKPKSKVPTKLL